MFFRLLSLLYLVLLALPALGACRNHPLTPPDQVRIADDSVMIVVHQSSTYDARFATKRGVDEAVRFAKSRKIPVIYLQDDTPDEFYFMADCYPDHWVYSQGGEIRFEVTASHVYIVGGHLELCMSAALHDIIYQWSKRSPRDFTVTYLMDAIYSNGRMIEPSDPYFADFERFMGIVTRGRPGGEHWPKLSLLETMGIIQREEHELDYIKKILPRWDRTFPANYRIAVMMNDSVKKVLRSAPGWHPPTVLFHFVDSALNLAEPRLDAF
ncbi:MAG: hypothetical protein HZB40_17485 [Rhodocyclales bacterium]|nr:hypothetical protein [Rhodocyclales bacterium]